MRSIMAAIAIAFLLSGCLTTRPAPVPVKAPPVFITSGNGAGSLKICFAMEQPGVLLGVSIDRITDDGKATNLEPYLAAPITTLFDGRNAEYFKSGNPCKVWRFQSAPGRFAVRDIRWKSIMATVIYSGGHVTRIPPDPKIYVTRFVDSRGAITSKTPTFEIREGEVTRLGTITFKQRDGYRDEHDKERDPGAPGAEDSNILLTVTYLIEYLTPDLDFPGEDPLITGNVQGYSNQLLDPFFARDIVLVPGERVLR